MIAILWILIWVLVGKIWNRYIVSRAAKVDKKLEPETQLVIILLWPLAMVYYLWMWVDLGERP